MTSKLKATLLAALASLALSSGAEANWGIGKITNGTSQPVTLSFPISPGSNNVSTSATILGNATLYIPAVGPMIFKELGHKGSNCSRPYWAVEITYGSQRWKFYFDGQGIVDVAIDALGRATLSPGTGSTPSSQVRDGYTIANCTE